MTTRSAGDSGRARHRAGWPGRARLALPILILGLGAPVLQAQTVDLEWKWAKSASNTTPVFNTCPFLGGLCESGVSVAADSQGNSYTLRGPGDNDTSTTDSNSTCHLDSETPGRSRKLPAAVLEKWGPDGTLLWSRQYGGIGCVKNNFFYPPKDTNGWYPVGGLSVSSYDTERGAVAVDGAGNVYFTATLVGTVPFGPIDANTVTTNNPDWRFANVVTVKHDSNGNVLWARSGGQSGFGVTTANSIAVDNVGNVFTSGGSRHDHAQCGDSTSVQCENAQEADPWNGPNDPGSPSGIGSFLRFDGPAGTFRSLPLGISQGGGFIVAYDTDGNVKWLQGMEPQSSNDAIIAKSIAVDGIGRVHAIGTLRGRTTEATAKVFFNWRERGQCSSYPSCLPSTGFYDGTTGPDNYAAWVATYDAANGNLLSHKVVAPEDASLQVGGLEIAADAEGNTAIAGTMRGPDNTKRVHFGNTVSLVAGSQAYALFVAKYEPNGGALWARRANAGPDGPGGVVLDLQGNVYLGGQMAFGCFNLGDMWTSPCDGIDAVGGAGNSHAFVTKYAANGALEWVANSSSTDGSARARATAIALDGLGNAFITGSFVKSEAFGNCRVAGVPGGTDEPCGALSVTESEGSVNRDFFVAKLNYGTNSPADQIAQLCPCALPEWPNHGAYVSCVVHASNDFMKMGLITNEERSLIVSEAGRSNCGKKN